MTSPDHIRHLLPPFSEQETLVGKIIYYQFMNMMPAIKRFIHVLRSEINKLCTVQYFLPLRVLLKVRPG